jgi:hypothetical protein
VRLWENGSSSSLSPSKFCPSSTTCTPHFQESRAVLIIHFLVDDLIVQCYRPKPPRETTNICPTTKLLSWCLGGVVSLASFQIDLQVLSGSFLTPVLDVGDSRASTWHQLHGMHTLVCSPGADTYQQPSFWRRFLLVHWLTWF